MEKRAIMYVWQFAIGEAVIFGRTWEQFAELLQELEIQAPAGIVIYVHNLSYEFQFMRCFFDWSHVFAAKERRPIYARTGAIEFRCSYILSGMSLARATEGSPYEKRIGDLDYRKIRHSDTPLTDEEWGYCAHDVLGLTWFINHKAAERGGDIVHLPYTKTGYVREYMRANTLYKENGKFNFDYKALMEELTIEPEEYKSLKRAFQGGFTHAAAVRQGEILDDVKSFDFCSSYPFVMACQYFPISKGRKVEVTDPGQLERLLNQKCCLFDVRFTQLEQTAYTDTPISASRCWKLVDECRDNGRLVSAEECCMTITELDYTIIKAFYKWATVQVTNFYIYDRGHLPPRFVRAMLKLYADKTSLKGVDGREIDYALAKEGVNSCYGMMVTDIVRDEYIYDGDEWDRVPADVTEMVEGYNKSRNRFLSYAWGVWVTAHARYNLFTGIAECGLDYVYADTDSIKLLNADKHKAYFDRYNANVWEQLKLSADLCGIDLDLYAPKTIKGDSKPLGVWEDDGQYSRFLTMGAKRYFYTDKKGMHITVAGVNKSNGARWLSEIPLDMLPLSAADIDDILSYDPMQRIRAGMVFPVKATGKLTMTYIDSPMTGKITDYTGREGYYFERSGVHSEGAEYCMGIADEYVLHTKYVKELMLNAAGKYWI